MPGPRAPDVRLFENHLVVIVINLAFEEPLHRFDDSPAADDGAVNVVVQLVLDDESYRPPFSVAAAGSRALHLVIGAGDRFEELDLLGIEEAIDKKKTVRMKSGDLVRGWGKSVHSRIPDAFSDDDQSQPRGARFESPGRVSPGYAFHKNRNSPNGARFPDRTRELSFAPIVTIEGVAEKLSLPPGHASIERTHGTHAQGSPDLECLPPTTLP